MYKIGYYFTVDYFGKFKRLVLKNVEIIMEFSSPDTCYYRRLHSKIVLMGLFMLNRITSDWNMKCVLNIVELDIMSLDRKDLFAQYKDKSY